MSCKVKNTRHSAIYDTIRALLKENNSINNLNDVVNWFKTNYPSIDRSEIVDSLVLPSDKNVKDSQQKLRKRGDDLRKQAKWINKVEMLLNGELARATGREVTDSPAAKQIKDAFNQLKQLSKQTDVSQDEIDAAIAMVEALPVSGNISETDILSAVNNLKELAKQDSAKRDNTRIATIANKMNNLLEGTPKRKPKTTRIAPSDQVAELQEALKMIEELAGQDSDITDTQYGDIISKVANIRNAYNQYFDTTGDISEAAIDKAVESIRAIRKEMHIDRLNKRIAEVRQNLQNLSDPDNIDINALLTDNTNIPWKAVDTEIIKKQIELQDLKDKVKEDIEKVRRKKLAEKGLNIMGFKFTGKRAQSMMNTYLVLKDVGWELPRTMAFMFDASAFGVQLAPIVIQDIMSPLSNFYKRNIMGREDIEVFQGWKRLKEAFTDGFWNVIKSDMDSVRGTREGLSHARGIWTRQKFQEIVNHPLYQLMDQAGLKISQAKSLTDSEEFFRTSLVNKIPIAGFIKDISEDTMVTTLNIYRVQLFEQFYKANPNLSIAEYGRVAEHINNLTGTTKDFGAISNSLAYFLSAPKLLIARGKLAFRLLGGANIQNLDIPKTLSEGGITKGVKFKDPAEAFVFNHLVGLGASYGALFGGLALLSMVFDEIDFGEDWEEKDFLRVGVGPTSFDVTGGLGAIYRTLAGVIYLTSGPSEDASDETKSRINYLKTVKKEDAISLVLRNMIRYKLHPTLTRGWSVASGLDFAGQPYSLFGETGGIAPNVAAALRATMPIFLETTIEQYFDSPNTGFLADTGINAAQFFGINTFEQSNKSQAVKPRKYMNDVGYSPEIRYPKELSGKESSPTKDYLKTKYKTMWGDALGELIESHDSDPTKLSADELSKLWSAEKTKVEQKFIEEYKEDLKELENAPPKPGAAPKKATRATRATRDSGRPTR